MKWFNTLTIAAVCFSALLTGCNKSEPKNRLKVAATAVPHAEILEQVQNDLRAKGIELEIVVVEDYNTPNRVLSDKEVDANFFQHIPFLDDQIHQFHYPLENFASIHLEPMGLYSKRFTELDQLPQGALIAVPSDPTNQARALLLLEKKGIISLQKHDVRASILDIKGSPKKVRVIEADSPMLARMLDDVDLAAITTNFALQAKLQPTKDAIVLEDNDSPFVNILAIRKGDEHRKALESLKNELQSEKIRDYINAHYQGAVVPAF